VAAPKQKDAVTSADTFTVDVVFDYRPPGTFPER